MIDDRKERLRAKILSAKRKLSKQFKTELTLADMQRIYERCLEENLISRARIMFGPAFKSALDCEYPDIIDAIKEMRNESMNET